MEKINKMSLAAIKEQINAGTRDVMMQTDDGGFTQAVFIPKFTIPAGAFGAYPDKDLHLGGFFIDKYQCSCKGATAGTMGVDGGFTVKSDDTTHIPLSVAGVTPWVNITMENAKQACANRKTGGKAWHLLTPKEWTTMCLLSQYLGHTLKGNNDYGKDWRDTDYGCYGVADPCADGSDGNRCLTGTGPNSWSHNGMANGVFDLLGNVWEFIDMTITDNIYVLKRHALINDSDGITAADTTITLDNLEDAEYWPDKGLVQIGSEQITYASKSTDSSGNVILSGCTRGANGTTAAVAADNADVYNLVNIAYNPGTATGWLTAALSTSDTALSYDKDKLVCAAGVTGISAGDILLIGQELVQVNTVNADGTLTIARAVNSSIAGEHKVGDAFVRCNPARLPFHDAGEAAGNYNWRQNGWCSVFRMDNGLQPYGFPLDVNMTNDMFGFQDNALLGTHVFLRGGGWGDRSITRGGVNCNGGRAPTDRWTDTGFRAALTL